MSDAIFTVALTAAELNTVIACLNDVADIRRSGNADELLLDVTADYELVGGIADKLEATLNPHWNPDED